MGSPSKWSFLDNFSPELFSFGFDPEILTCFWGIFRSSPDINPAAPPRFIPSIPFQITVPFHGRDGGTILSILQCGVATSGVVLVVTLSSYGVYSVLQSAREKFVKPHVLSNSSSSSVITVSECSELTEKSDKVPSKTEVDGALTRPTTLNVMGRSAAAGSSSSNSRFGILSKIPSLRAEQNIVKEIAFDLDEDDDMGDIQGEYFGPANIEDCLEDSAGSSDFQTPCA